MAGGAFPRENNRLPRTCQVRFMETERKRGTIMADWMPGKREDILAMASTWAHELLSTNPPRWGVPVAEAEGL